MRHRHNLWALLFPGAHICDRINHMEKLMSDIEARLNDAISQLGTDLGEAVDRIERKLADADINVDDEIAQLRSFSEQLDGIAADPVEPPVDEPVDPNEPIDPDAPVEP